ncbi:hypothetical protein EDB80DRAFT_839379 [Ilyonectria destructans]|nr:hypothetical protein EDB80DRAFT_839379 [Ilyonectria destructans]
MTHDTSNSTPILSPIAPSCPGVTDELLVWRLRDDLVAAVHDSLPSIPIKKVGDECFDLVFHRLFPCFPLLHEPSLRASACQFFDSIDGSEEQSSPHGIGTQNERIALMRSFASVTFICGTAAFTFRRSFLPYGDLVGVPFLWASREMLRHYEDYDLQHPNSTSIAIRALHSSSLKRHTGQNGLAWHVFGQASLIAQALRLHSEKEVIKYNTLEATLLRFSFWVLYVSDKSAISMRIRAIVFHEPLFDSEMDIDPYGPDRVALLDPTRPHNQPPFEDTLLARFHLIRRNWSFAARIFWEIRSFTQ